VTSKKDKEEETLGIAGPSKVYLHEVSLYVPGGVIAIVAGFTEQLPVAAVLGMNGFFDTFKVVFDPSARRCELQRMFQT